VNIKSVNRKSSFDKPEFSGPNRIAIFLLEFIFLLKSLKSIVEFLFKYLFLFVIYITYVKFLSASF
jgi:hypothetical protein